MGKKGPDSKADNRRKKKEDSDYRKNTQEGRNMIKKIVRGW